MRDLFLSRRFRDNWWRANGCTGWRYRVFDQTLDWSDLKDAPRDLSGRKWRGGGVFAPIVYVYDDDTRP